MTRLGRYRLAGWPQHVIHRGNNRQAIFFREQDYRRFLEFLAAVAEKYGCALHAYVLMTNHVHLLLTPEGPDSLSAMMQSLGRRYTGYANAVHERTGTLWEGRYRASVIDGEAYFLACSRYIENNPARAGLVARLADYPWSSYRANALGESDPILRPHALYQGLADGPSERQAAYRALFETALAEAELEALRVATNRGWALGGAAFRRSVEKAAGQRAGPQARGRPRRRR